ncbi:2-octaprenyl-6-methoxyphenol hydroxylase [Nitrosomonas nitrosa]|uniref:2-octaprenyl-6-methoxyphenol hydroxylase n=1 Tax=Nitrosomonas nitrosa TaxID=52442 RepID=A0A1I4MD79_9PROT|nr:FAD-dependent monooxygenase [Nitrosomonas nitrosa]SFM01056.1 2-octaprenyl-6-methoxyphenol hydroxylase [Nitrosomonas nitrosa]
MTTDRFDVVLAGGGPVGMALALRLHARAIPTLLLEAQGVPEQAKDPRPLALSYGSRLILQRLGVWARLSQITPINKIHISNRGYFGRTVLTSQEAGVPELGYVVNYHDLHHSMHQLLQSSRGANYQLGAMVSKLTTTPDEATVEYQQHGESKCAAAKLLVLADGGQLAAQIPNIRYHAHEYQQWAVVANVETTIPQSGIAYERFTTDGPVALLPSGTGYALVWTVPAQSVKEILALNDQTFLSALQCHFGDRPGKFIHTGKRSGFPLSLKYAVPATAMRTALIGNASQTLHPVAGQGFNLGLRDAWELSSEISTLSATPSKIGSQGMLHSYEQKRQLDRNAGKFFTDSLAKIFTIDFPVFQTFCGIGLSVLDCLPPAKRFVARRMIFGARG